MPNANQDCVVITLVAHHIEQACDEGLRELERRGYVVWRHYGCSAVDHGRCAMATKAMVEGFAETLWIDSDIGFDPDDVEELRAHGLPLVCGIYPKKGPRQLACHVRPGTEEVTFGKGGGLVELLYCGAGFLHVRREVYETIQTKLELPTCNQQAGEPLVPYFLPVIHQKDGKPWYLTEDYSFCERARQCGYRIMADSSIRLWHYGSYGFSWEDAGSSLPRYEKYRFRMTPKESD